MTMVTIYGLNDKIGNVTMIQQDKVNIFSKPYSETAKVIDTEISTLIESQYQEAIAILEENKDS
jgi:cell division protease FtsH